MWNISANKKKEAGFKNSNPPWSCWDYQTLRPFDFDTLSVRIYQYAGDERMVEAILPAILIMTLGLIASITLIPSLEKKN